MKLLKPLASERFYRKIFDFSMADGYLESHYAEYEQRKAAWLKKKKKLKPRPLVEKPEDEAL